MTDVIALAKQLAARENLVGKCQRLVGLIGDHQQGTGWSVPPYGRATDAYNACRNAGLILGGLEAIATFTPDMVGWVAYFEYRDANNNGHVGIIVGPDLMVSTTGNRAGFVADLGRGVFLSTISGYSTSRKLLGISRHNGTRDRIERLTSPYAPPAGPNVRTVRSDIGNARRRVAPDTGAALTPKDAEIKAGTACRITKAYLTGHPVAQAGVTTDVWFEVGAYGWAWAGSFTSQSLDGIPEVIDARPTPTPTPEPEPDPEPEPIPAPDPEPETPADPTIDPQPEPADPITEEDAMTVNQIIAPPELETGALGAVVEDPRTRKRLYAWYVIAALALGALITGTVAGVAAAATLATIGLAPWLHVWVVVLAIAVGVVGYVGPYAAVLASANTPKK